MYRERDISILVDHVYIYIYIYIHIHRPESVAQERKGPLPERRRLNEIP